NRACSLGSDIRSSVSKNFSLPTAFISAMSSVILTYFRMTLNLGGLTRYYPTSPATRRLTQALGVTGTTRSRQGRVALQIGEIR
ncbi:hypothetical protein, partial [Methylicorpusculum sp.]|uniref:hypothetical protein n=1 Tax=Methylicorpusculum sp. TaxID=2713644 RepID=UPI002ABB182B